MAEQVPPGVAASQRPQGQNPRVAERQDRHDRLRDPAARVVTMPGDAVRTVPVQAQARRAQRLAEHRPIALVERGHRLGQRGVGQLLPRTIEAQQPGHRDHPVIHRAPLSPPRHGLKQPLEHVIGAGHPARQHIKPGSLRQRRSPQPSEVGDLELLVKVKQRSLERDSHDPSIAINQTHVRLR